MIRFKSEDRFPIEGRGIVFTVVIPEDFDSSIDLKGKVVIMDGMLGKVVGIERWIKDLGKPLNPGDKVGLLLNTDIYESTT